MSYQYGTKCGPLRAAQVGGLPKRKAVTEAISGNIASVTVSKVDGNYGYVGVPRPGSNGGNFTINSNGTWTFDPAGEFGSLSGARDTATTSVTYHASDGTSEVMGTLTVTVSSWAAPGSWTPAEITTALWLDAADGATITLNGSTVSEWRDKSGNGRHLTQNTASYQPAISGTDIVFSGDYLASATLSLNVNGYGVAAVYSSSATGSTYAGLLNLRSSNFEDPELRFGKSNDVMCYADGVYKINVDAGVTTKNISVVYFSATETALYKNGAPVVSSTASSLSPVVSIKVGHYDASDSQHSGTRNGTVNEIVIYQQTLDNRQKIEGYLAHKWSLAADLPADHPYKSAAPTL